MRVLRIASIAFVCLTLWVETGASSAFIQGPRQIGQVRPQRPRTRPNNLRAADAAPIQEIVEGFYVSRIQEALDLSDEQFTRVLPALRNSLRQRNELGVRRARALNALRQAVENNGSDDEIRRRIREVDESDLALRQVQQDLIDEVDPGLSPTQRARLRLVQPRLEERIRDLIQRSRSANRTPN